MKRLLRSLCLFLLAASVSASAGEIALRDLTSRGFAPDVVRYAIPRGATPPPSLTDEAGAGVPVQVVPPAEPGGESHLAFVAELPPGGARVYRAGSAEARKPEGLGLAVQGDAALLSNSLLSVKVPAPGERAFAPARPLSSLPAPLLGFRTGNAGFFRGSSRWLGERPVKSLSVKAEADGPVFVAVAYEIAFEGGGFYRARIEVADKVPMAKIAEEYDLGPLEKNEIWELDLTGGWEPDRIESMRALGNGLFNAKEESLKEFLATKVAAGGGGYGTGGSNSQPGVAPASDSHVARRLVPDSGWSGDMVSFFGVWNAGLKSAEGSAAPMAGVVPLNKGFWRRPNAWDIANDRGALVARIPVGVVPQSWLREITSESSPFSMHEHDPALPATFGRRLWGLQLAGIDRALDSIHGDGQFYRGKVFYGIVGLDRYKDFVLEWPDGGATYPRVFIREGEREKYRAAWESSPIRAGLDRFSFLTGSEETARKNADGSIEHLRGNAGYMLTTPAMGHHHTYTWVAAMADDALSWRGLPAEKRARIRSLLALTCYLYAEPDVNSAGLGQHHGNPNMSLARLSDRSNFLALLPDHPAFGAWRDYAAEWLGYKLGTFTAPGGGWIEFGGAYHAHGFARASRGIFGLLGTGSGRLPELLDYARPNWGYYMNLLTPFDGRYRARMIPGGANSPPGYTENFVEAAGVFSDATPELAANLRWAWEANGAATRNYDENFVALMDRPWIAPKEPRLGSLHVPGVGVIFRAHQGPLETYLYFRSGYHWSHWYEDQGHFIAHSRGAALVPGQPYQYYGIEDKTFDLYNTIRFGDPSNKYDFGWPDSFIVDHAFFPNVDYAWSSSGYPDWFIGPGKAKGFGGPLKLADVPGQREGAFHWNRQVLFLKGRGAESPNYFAFRDTMPAGGLASWWFLNLIGGKSNVAREGANLRAETEWPVGLDVRFLQGGGGALDLLEDTNYLAAESSAHGKHLPQTWRENPEAISKNWVRRDGKPVDAAAGAMPDGERRVILRLANRPGAEFFWLLYPRAKGEPEPEATALAPGVCKVITPEGTDYVFLGPTPFAYEGEGVRFSGTSGSVRVRKSGEVILALCGAGGGLVAYGGRGFESVRPFEVSLADGGGGDKGGGIERIGDPPAAESPRVEKVEGGARFIHPGTGYVELVSGDRAIRGCGPFALTFRDDGIEGTASGHARTLSMSKPPALTRPMFWLDGVRWAAGIPDDSSPFREVPGPQRSIAVALLGGQHTIRVAEWVWPSVPPAPQRRSLP